MKCRSSTAADCIDISLSLKKRRNDFLISRNNSPMKCRSSTAVDCIDISLSLKKRRNDFFISENNSPMKCRSSFAVDYPDIYPVLKKQGNGLHVFFSSSQMKCRSSIAIDCPDSCLDMLHSEARSTLTTSEFPTKAATMKCRLSLAVDCPDSLDSCPVLKKHFNNFRVSSLKQHNEVPFVPRCRLPRQLPRAQEAL